MNLRYVKSLAIAALVALGILPAAVQAQLVDLGVATGYAINNAGQVALSTGIYTSGTVTALPALPGSTSPAVPLAINDTGQAVGYAVDSTGIEHAVRFSNGALTDLNATIAFNNIKAEATGINASGTVVGWLTCPADGESHPACEPYEMVEGFIFYENGTYSYVANTLNDFTYGQVFGINNNNQVTGSIEGPVPGEPGQADAEVFITSAPDLGTGTGYAINASGQATGTLGGSVFLYSDGKTTNLGGGTGYAINSAGQIVGSTGPHAFLYNGAMVDLNALVSPTDPLHSLVTLTGATGINDSGVIVVNGIDSRTNQYHAYLLQAPSISFAPAALGFAMLAVGGTSQAQSVTVTNAGTTAIPIGTAYVNGDFSLRLDTCGASLAPSSQCRLAVVFVPQVVGVLSGALTIPSAGANYEVPLSGVAPITAKISASSSTATAGQPLTLTWTVSAGSTCTAASSVASTPAFAGTVPVSGKQTLTETTAGAVTYQINCTAPGVAAVSASASVVWHWPVLTATITASPTTITAGQTTTLTWKSFNATSCTASGGGADDNWPGTKATSGSQKVTEAAVLASPVTLTFGITCISSTSGLSDKASVNVTEGQTVANGVGPPTSSGGGGGGALNPLSLAFLAGILALRRVRGRVARPGQ